MGSQVFKDMEYIHCLLLIDFNLMSLQNCLAETCPTQSFSSNRELSESYKDPKFEQPSLNPRCRICLEENKTLMQPCKCKGTMAYVHQSCMKEWIEVRQERIFDTYFSTLRSMPCEICQEQISYEGNIERKCSKKELKSKVKKFTAFFIAHTILLILLLIPTVVLTILLLNTYKNVDLDSDIAPVTIQSVFLVLTSMTFLKMLMIWLRDYAVSNRIYVTKIYEASSPPKQDCNAN